MSFTPAPWPILYAGQDEMTEAECIAEGMPVVSVGPINYAEFADEGTATERANASLVAASPKLLEACLLALKALRGEVAPSVAERVLEKAIEEAEK